MKFDPSNGKLVEPKEIPKNDWRDKYPKPSEIKSYKLEDSADDSTLNRMVQLRTFDNTAIVQGKPGAMYYDKANQQILVYLEDIGWVNLYQAFPMGEISYFNTTGTTVSIASASDGSTNMVKADVASTLSQGMDFDNGGSDNGRLRYTGTPTCMFHVAGTISISPVGANDNFVFGIAKNGTVIAASKVAMQAINASQNGSTVMHVVAELATNEYLELYVGNLSDTDDCKVISLNLFAMGIRH